MKITPAMSRRLVPIYGGPAKVGNDQAAKLAAIGLKATTIVGYARKSRSRKAHRRGMTLRTPAVRLIPA